MRTFRAQTLVPITCVRSEHTILYGRKGTFYADSPFDHPVSEDTKEEEKSQQTKHEAIWPPVSGAWVLARVGSVKV